MLGGKKRVRASIEEATEVQNSFGEAIVTWSEYSPSWISIEPINGKEFYQAQAAQAQATHKITCNFISGVTPKMRIVVGSRVFLIRGKINIKEGNRELAMMCVEDV